MTDLGIVLLFPTGTDEKVAYEQISAELTLDGNPLLNLASFVHTHMDDGATKLVMESINKNLIDSDEVRGRTLRVGSVEASYLRD